MTQVCSSLTVALFIDLFNLDAVQTPRGYGLMLTCQTVIPIFTCIPFFYLSGVLLVKTKRETRPLKLSYDERDLESKKASAFIWSNGGADATLFNEPVSTGQL